MTSSSAVAVRKFKRALMEECILYKRWINQHDMSMGQRKNLSPWQESNLWPPKHCASTLSTELWELLESKVIKLSSYATSVLTTTMISIVAVIIAWRSGGHVFDSFLSLGFFFVPCLCHVDQFSPHFITKLKICEPSLFTYQCKLSLKAFSRQLHHIIYTLQHWNV